MSSTFTVCKFESSSYVGAFIVTENDLFNFIYRADGKIENVWGHIVEDAELIEGIEKAVTVFKGEEARKTYKRNHSDLRGLARYCSDREKKLRQVCEERKFWFGDRWAKPASVAAQAALRVLNGSMRSDPLLCNVINAKITTEQKKMIDECMVGALRVYR